MKEERIKCVTEKRIGNIAVIGNAVMTSRNEILEKSFTKVIKIKDSTDREEHMRHKHG